MERLTDSQTWIVVFDKAFGGIKWWHFFLHPRFRHVFLVKDNRGYCLMVNSMSQALCIKEYPNSLCDFIQQELAQNPTAILQYTVHYHSHYRPSPIEPITCVSVAKRILGIRTRLFTPKRLYHELIRAGAVVIKPYSIT